jgi:hypothetical protein
MANEQFGTNTPSVRKQRLYYEGTNTIYEGMPVCYNYDTTTNVLGLNKAYPSMERNIQILGGIDPDVTAEGYQNEGKFLRVEDPSTTNLEWFAGVICAGGYVGKTGPKWVDVYEPNGAIVPVRCAVSSTVGSTILAVTPSASYFGQPVNSLRSRPVAVAEETVSGTTGTPLLCLAKVNPNMFMWQNINGAGLNVGTGVSTEVQLCTNFLAAKSAQTDGDLTVLKVIGEIAGAGGSAGYGVTQLKLYVNSASQGTPPTMYAGGACNTILQFATGATATGYFYAGRFLVENDDSTPATVAGATICSIMSSLNCNTNAPAVLTHMRFEADGTSKPGYFFVAKSNDAVCYAAASSISNVGTLKIQVGGVDKYIVLSSAA